MHTLSQHRRTKVVLIILDFLFLCLVGRLFYWQVLHRSDLQAQAQLQYTKSVSVAAHRGKIFTSDGATLVTNKNVFRLFAEPGVLQTDPAALANMLAPLLVTPDAIATTAAEIQSKLSDPKLKWVALRNKVDESTKQKIDGLHLRGLGFDQYETRDYPEASMAAQVTGFVGKDKDGNDVGYFGVEGDLDRELKGHTQQSTFLKDGLGFRLLFDHNQTTEQQDGRNVTLTLRRDIQYMVEDMLRKGLEYYQSPAGEVIVMDPKTGKILAMAASPSYDQAQFQTADPSTYKNPSLTDSYEPGSIFKVLTVAAGIDTGVIKEDTPCTKCAGPRQIAEYSIKTWNDEYTPNITMNDALAKSDNTAMIFISDLLGKDRFLDYVHRFKIGEPTHIELQEDTGTPLRKDSEWKPIDLATGSFGQGVVTTSMQMVRAVGAIANHGIMMRPTIIEHVSDPVTHTDVEVQPVEEGRVVSAETADTVTRMMVYAADKGESHWTASKTHLAAAKTGTAQVPVAGHYDKDRTIASFIGFAPPNDPKFVMIVKLKDTKKSPWAAETAAPLWYHIADKLYMLLNVPGDR